MTLQEANDFFKSLETETTKNSEIKVYQKFIQIITSLEKKKLSETEIQSIEIALDSLHLELSPRNRKKYFEKALNKFKKYLEHTFSLTSKGYYAKLYGGLGLLFGLLFGVVFLTSWERSLGISLGLIVGMLIGATIGRFMDIKVINEGRAL